MPNAVALLWDLAAKDQASPAFLRVAAAADKAAVATERASRGVEAGAARMSAAGAKLTKAITLPVLGIAAVSLKMAGDFQQSTNVLVTAAGESVKNLAMVRKGILDISTTTGTSWKSVTDGMYQLEKAGFRGADALMVEKAAAQAAREEGAKLSTVTAAATSIMASYHLKATAAVSVMNQMKTAAGESKTTMEEFAGSLSTVLPLASANKISFADIAGSLASLTQHGTSADEAAQELAFTMRGLAAPNQVAMKEMAKLGISSLDVAQKLGDGPGGRGLAGTLKYLSDTVLHSMGKSGLVLLNTFNQTKMATAAVVREFAALPPSMQKVAAQFRDGKIIGEDWRLFIRKLPVDQANLAKQFAVTVNRARGFTTELRNGVSSSQTYSDAIKKMTGGANGLNTVLQLTGESMKGTDERISRIAAAANGASKDVSGWASTQKLFNVQLDILKEKMARTAIQLGTALIPAVTKLVGGLQSAVQWFTHLSSTDKKIMGWSIGILAALGPVMAIGGRLALLGVGINRFTTGAVNQLARFNTGLALNANRVALTMTRFNAALGGAAVGAAVGSLTANASNAKKAVGIIASIGIGAAMGSAGGGLGAVIGGLAGGLSALATQFLGAGHAARYAVKPTDDYTNAILADSDAVGKNTRKLVENDLQKRGLYDIGLKLSINQKTLTDAAMGNSTALDLVREAQGRVIYSVLSSVKAHKELTKEQLAARKASTQLDDGLGILNKTLAVNKHAADNLAAADGKGAATAKKYTGYLGNLGEALTRVYGPKRILDLEIRDHATKKLVGIEAHLDSINGKIVAISAISLGAGGFSTKGDAGKTIWGLASGGPVVGRGPKGVDSEHRILAPGEWVISDRAVDKYGAGFMAAVNAGTYRAPTARQMAPIGSGGGGTVQHVTINQHITRPEGEPTSVSLPASMRAAAAAMGALG